MNKIEFLKWKRKFLNGIHVLLLPIFYVKELAKYNDQNSTYYQNYYKKKDNYTKIVQRVVLIFTLLFISNKKHK